MPRSFPQQELYQYFKAIINPHQKVIFQVHREIVSSMFSFPSSWLFLIPTHCPGELFSVKQRTLLSVCACVLVWVYFAKTIHLWLECPLTKWQVFIVCGKAISDMCFVTCILHFMLGKPMVLYSFTGFQEFLLLFVREHLCFSYSMCSWIHESIEVGVVPGIRVSSFIFSDKWVNKWRIDLDVLIY